MVPSSHFLSGRYRACIVCVVFIQCCFNNLGNMHDIDSERFFKVCYERVTKLLCFTQSLKFDYGYRANVGKPKCRAIRNYYITPYE